MGTFTWAAVPPQISTSLSSPKVRPGTVVQLSVIVKTEDEANVEPPQWSAPPGVVHQGMQTRTAIESRLLPGPNGMQFEKKRSVEFVFQLHAGKEGNFKLGPFSIKVDTQTYSLGPIFLEVSAKAPAPKVGQGSGRPGGGIFPPGFDDEDESLFGQLLRRQQQQEQQPQNLPSKNLPINEKEAFFIIVETDKTEAYEGEQVFASWYIYTRGNIHQFDRLRFPALKGFWKEDVEPAPNLNFQKELVNGVLFHRALLASYALFPIKAGLAVIDEYKIRAMVSLPTSGFGGFGFGQPYSYTRSSTPQKITIKPLPVEGKPDSFSGAVGKFKVEAHVDNQNFIQGQPFTLKVRFDGDGNAKLIELPKLQWPSAFELYDTKAESRFFQSGKSYKEFVLLVIPKESGVLKIPPFEFSYFDPATGIYETIQSQEVALQVLPGTVQANNSERMILEGEKAKDNAPKLPEPAMARADKNWQWLAGLPMVFVWSGLYSMLFAVFFLLEWLWRKRLYQRKRLIDELNERKQKWEKALDRSESALVATEVINAIYYLLSRLIDDGGFTKDLAYLLDQLPPSIRGEVSEPLRKELAILQAVAFAPEEAWKDLATKAELRKHTEKTFQLLQQTLRLADEGASVAS
jgi:hypothetical protein